MDTLMTSPIISAVAGFLAALLVLPIQTIVANSKAMKTIQQVYGGTIRTLETQVAKLEKEVNRWKSIRCERVGCKNRLPPKVEVNEQH
jgi:hypothetical protein